VAATHSRRALKGNKLRTAFIADYQPTELFHSGKYSAQDTDQGMQVPNANLLQGDFICAVFKNSIQHTIVGTLKSWDQGESD
jgi:hypothetical protein